MILAIDLGSTNIKAAVFDADLAPLGDGALPTPYTRHDGAAVEMDADAVCATVLAAAEGACRSAGIRSHALTAVAVTSQAQNFTILGPDGKARLPVISWLDPRSAAEAATWANRLGGDWHRHSSFPGPTASMQLAHLLWVRRHRPEVLAGAARLVTLPGLVFHRLAGCHLTDDNLAAMGGAWSLAERAWRTEALACCGLTPAQMPTVVPVGSTVVAATTDAWPLPASIRLVPAGNDQTAGAYGNGCGAGDAIVTLGTALVVYRFAGAAAGPFGSAACWGPYPGGGYYELACRNTGCLALDWAHGKLMPDRDIAAFDAAAARALARMPEGMGHFDPASIHSAAAWRGHFDDDAQRALAVLEGIAADLRDLLETLAVPAAAHLRVIGGGRHSAVWMQIVADVLDRPVAVGRGDSLLGAAAMAAGRRPDARTGSAYRPNPATRRWFAHRRQEKASGCNLLQLPIVSRRP